MIACLIVTTLALLWLGLETEWMMIRLPMGSDILPVKCEYKTWEQLKPRNPNKQYPFWVRCPDYMSPLCGWDYIKNTMHIIPEYRFEIIAFGVKSRINLKKGDDARLIKAIADCTLKATKAQKLAYA